MVSMSDFGMDLNTIEPALGMLHGGNRSIFGACGAMEAGGKLGDLVAMAHPNIAMRLVPEKRGEEFALCFGCDARMTKLALFGWADRTAELLGHGLHPVANPEYGHAQLEDDLRDSRGSLSGDALGAPGENDPLGGKGLHCGSRDIERVDLAVDPGLADAPRDQLGVLRTKVDDEQTPGVNICGAAMHGFLKPKRVRLLRHASEKKEASSLGESHAKP